MTRRPLGGVQQAINEVARSRYHEAYFSESILVWEFCEVRQLQAERMWMDGCHKRDVYPSRQAV